MVQARDTLRVFISYARDDAAAFADELLRGLELAGFEAVLDRHDIAVGEDWEKRLGGLIESADTVVFVLTPESAKSPRCAWELDRAFALAKRVIPLVLLKVAEEETPERVRRLNYVFFNEGRSYSLALSELAKALRVDLSWIREHTRLGELARRWEDRARNQALLLRGPELDAARAWQAAGKDDAPAVTEQQREFIAASEAAEGELVKRERRRRRRLVWGLSAATAIFAVLGGVAAILGLVADSNARLAQAALSRALVERTWDLQGEDDVLNLKYALAGYEMDRSSALTRSALAFALERGQLASEIASDLEGQVNVAALSPDGRTVAMIDRGGALAFIDVEERTATTPIVIGAAHAAGFSADGRRLFVARADNTGVLFNRDTGGVAELGGIGSVTRFEFSPDGRRLLLSGFHPTVQLWDVESGRMVSQLIGHQNFITAARFSADGSLLLTASGDNTARIWNARTGAAVATFHTDSYVIDAVFSPDGRLVATSAGVEHAATSDGAVARSPGAIVFWQTASGRMTLRVRHEEDVRALAFSPDGTKLFGLDEAGRFIQWDTGTGRALRVFDGRRFGVLDGAFSADGSIFVGPSQRFAAVVWEGRSNRVIGLLSGLNSPPSRVLGVRGDTAILMRATGSVIVWDFSRALAASDQLAAQGCAALRQGGQLRFSELELASDPLIAEARAPQGARRLCSEADVQR
jgi:WD40 repeat protein